MCIILDMKKYWMGLLLWAVLGCALAATPQPLPIDQAFPLSVWSPDAQTIVVQWDVQSGYYLYKDRIHFAPAVDGAAQLGEPRFPAAVEHNTILGRFAVYDSPVQVTIPVIKAASPNFSLEIKYQGCAVQGFCYPPATRVVAVTLAASAANPPVMDHIPGAKTAVAPPTVHPVEKLLQHHYSWKVWLGFFGLGLLISLTPCVLPMIPVVSALILGKENISHVRAFFISLAYVLGMAVTYAIAGLLFGSLGGSLQTFFQKPWIIAVLSGIFILMAVSLFGVFHLEPPQKLRVWIAGISHRQRSGSFAGAAVMGSLSTLILSPCATPPLVAVLGYISQAGNAYLGGIALFIIGLGSGVPLLLIGAFGRRLLPKAGSWMKVIEKLLGVILLAVSIWMLSRILPATVVFILWAALAMGVAVYLRTFNSVVTPIQKLGKVLGIILFVFGVLLMAHAVHGKTAEEHCVDQSRFIKVKTPADVQAYLSAAAGKPVLLDFYADWCVSCKIIEKQVFENPAVQQQMSHFLLLRADVTANDAEDRQLLQQYQVVAPPTMIFFNTQHQEIPQLRVVGEISPQEFNKKLQSVN